MHIQDPYVTNLTDRLFALRFRRKSRFLRLRIWVAHHLFDALIWFRVRRRFRARNHILIEP